VRASRFTESPIRAQRERTTGEIEERFRDHFSPWGITIPTEHVRERRRGKIVPTHGISRLKGKTRQRSGSYGRRPSPTWASSTGMPT
jgi:hypothetical protein